MSPLSSRIVAQPLIHAQDLAKTFRQGFWMRRVEAVRGISFTVNAGDIFGFLGPNGAGKTTTIKMLTGLIEPTGGEASVFGHPVPSPRAMARVGFLPENPYVYPYLTPLEFVAMCARISGVPSRFVRERTRAALERVGILYAADRAVRRLSKGMLQRTGLAAALVSDPELLILDEPMSGLDPVGRKEVRDLIIEERSGGRTIFFSTHILSDVETLCDRVTILRQGRVVVEGALADLLRTTAQQSDVVLRGAGEAFEAWCVEHRYVPSRAGGRFLVRVPSAEVNAVLRRAIDEGLEVVQVLTRQETLEDLFVREAIEGEDRESTPATHAEASGAGADVGASSAPGPSDGDPAEEPDIEGD